MQQADRIVVLDHGRIVPDKTRVEVVKLKGYTIGRFNFQPGWRWSGHDAWVEATSPSSASKP